MPPRTMRRRMALPKGLPLALPMGLPSALQMALPLEKRTLRATPEVLRTVQLLAAFLANYKEDLAGAKDM